MTPPEKLIVRRGQAIPAEVLIQLRSGYHVNSNTPADPYLIPLKLTLTSKAVEVTDIEYPKPLMQKFSFSEKPVSVFEGDFKARAKLKILPNAPVGMNALDGKLRYQACNDRMCLPPRTLDLKIPVDIRQ